MDTIQNIRTRKSVRKYTEEPISEQEIHTILAAGMSGPTCVNARQWSFIVVTDHDMLVKMAQAAGPTASPLKRAPMGMLVCGDLTRAFKPAPDYWVVDGSIAIQNMILAAHDLDIGSVWLGVWPQMDRVENLEKLFDLPETVIPHSLVAFGHPAKEDLTERDLYEADRVHFEKW